MKRLLLALAGLAAIALVAFVLLHRSEPTPAAVTLLPATTVALVDIPNFQQCRAKVAASPVARFWNDPAVHACLEKQLSATIGSQPGSSELAAILTDVTLALPHGEAFLAITHVTTLPALQCTLAAGVDLYGHKLATQATLKVYEYELRKHNPAASVAVKKFRGVKYAVWQLAPDAQLCHAFFGTLLVFTTDEATLCEMITRAAGKADAPGLAASAGYQNILRQLPEQRDLHAYLDVEQLVSRFSLPLRFAMPNNPLVQQLTNIQAWGTGVTFGETNITDVDVTTFTNPNQPAPPLQQTTLAAAPADSTLYWAGTPNLAVGYRTVLDVIKLAGNRDTAQFVAGAELMLAFAGVRIDKDFLAKLGPEVAIIGNWRPGATAPDLALVAEVRDQPALVGKFRRITGLLDAIFKTTDAVPVADEILQVVRTSTGYASPAFALTDKFFVLALTADYGREIITQIKTGNAVLPVAAVGNSVTYCDTRQFLAGLYSLTGSNTIAQLGQLPEPETIAKHTGIYTATTITTTNGSRTTTHSTLGKPVTGLITLVGAFAAAQPWLARLPVTIPGLPTKSSNTVAHLPPAGNQTATSQTPTP
ncbi:MAG: DUF3352 domain-containing protein [Verrucomicrobiota bacterium]